MLYNKIYLSCFLSVRPIAVSASGVSPTELASAADGTWQTVFALIELVSIVAAIVYFFIGLKKAVSDIGYVDKKNPENEEIVMGKAMSKSMTFIGTGIVLYLVSRFAANYLPMRAEGFGWLEAVMQSFWEAIYRTGFLLIIPYIIKQWRKTARRNAYKENH